VSTPAVSAAPADDTDDDSRHRQLTVLAGWRRFTDEEPAPPELLPGRQWRQLGDAGRLAYDEARLNHHSRLLVVATPVIRKVITEGRRLSYLNRNADSGRCGLILSGPARTGKTTAITQLGKTLEVIHRQRHPRSGGDIPVIYITVPPAATAKMIAIEFARFLGLPVIRRANLTDIIESVCGVCADTRTGLVAVDEIHNVSLATRPGAEASDMLKYFSERIPATFVFSELKMIMNISCSEGFSGRVPDGCDQELDVAVVETGEGVPEIDGYAVGQACRDLQQPLLAPGAGKA
jgi:hypothetical protein